MALKACDRVIGDHTGVISVSGNAATEAQLKMSEVLRKDLRKSLIYCAVATLVYLATDVCYVLMAKDYGFMLLINIVGIALFISVFAKTYFDIFEAVESKYILE